MSGLMLCLGSAAGVVSGLAVMRWSQPVEASETVNSYQRVTGPIPH